VVVLPHPYLYPLIRVLDASIPIIYDSQNAESSLKRSVYPIDDVGNAMASAVADVERALLRRARLVIAVSDSDVDELRALTPTLADFAVIPNGASFATTEFVVGDARRRRRELYMRAMRQAGMGIDTEHIAIFIGSGHPPNVIASHRVMEAAAAMPDVLFILLGSHVQQLGSAPVGRNVVARGVVPQAELELILSIASVGLNPMTTGSGTNIKMLDYFAAGVPAVSSLVGARGLPVEDGRHLLIADPAKLDGAIRAILYDPDEADRRALAAREVARPYDWSNLGNRFARLIQTIVDGEAN
jgi:glycosyltransferase involved in cell wall biosynthesis